jgi:cob(I)alamin adenosyltransferase
MYKYNLEQGLFYESFSSLLKGIREKDFFMAIYTRTGDKGKTSLFSGIRVSKADLRVETYGTVDELNSVIGLILSLGKKYLNLNRELIKIQRDLLDIGSALANPKSKPLNYLEKRVKEFENLIDEMTKSLPPLKNFILPGGGKTGAMLNLARTVCRRAERRIVALNGQEKIDNNIIVYFNRLSDLLFIMARFLNFKEKKKEAVWKKNV